MSELEEYPTLRRALAISLLAGLVLAGVTVALGAGNQSNQGGTLNGGVSLSAPKIRDFDLNNTGAGNLSQNGKGLDIPTTYQLVVTVNSTNGWSNVSAMYFDLWYDNGSASLGFSGQAAGKNYKLNISYSNPGQATSPSLGQWTNASGGNIFYDQASSWIRQNAAGQNYSFGIAFKLHDQVHHATTPATPSTSGYDNLQSWNAQFGVMNTSGGLTWQQKNTTGYYLEFGVNQYTSFISSAPTWTISSIAPGAETQTNTVVIHYSSNGNYSFNVTLMGLLTSGVNTIAASNVKVYGGGIAGPPGTAYGGTGAGFTIYLWGGASSYILQSADDSSATVSVTFSIAVPLGTPAGTYTAPIVLTVNQAAAP